MPPILLLTRPLHQSRAFADAVARTCPPHATLIAPLSEVIGLPYDPAVFEGAKGLILTSANAVPHLPALPPLPAWCVGPATARAARAAGFTPLDGGGDAAALIEALDRARPPTPLVHAHGLHIARDLVAAMALRGQQVRSVAVYEARALDLSEPARAALRSGREVIAPLFSPRAARLFARQMAGAKMPGLRPVAISAACAAALPEELRARCVIADAPDGEAMLRAVVLVMSQAQPAG